MRATDIRQAMAFVVGLVLSACTPVPLGRSPSPNGSVGLEPTTSPPAATVTTAPDISPSFVRPTPLPSPTFLVYEVRAGDTLLSIARQFGTTARSIAYWNRKAYPSLDPDSPTYEPGLIKVGWTLLLIPTAVVDEDELPDPTEPPSPSPTASTPTASGSPG